MTDLEKTEPTSCVVYLCRLCVCSDEMYVLYVCVSGYVCVNEYAVMCMFACICMCVCVCVCKCFVKEWKTVYVL